MTFEGFQPSPITAGMIAHDTPPADRDVLATSRTSRPECVARQDFLQGTFLAGLPTEESDLMARPPVFPTRRRAGCPHMLTALSTFVSRSIFKDRLAQQTAVQTRFGE
jgi:hypothetical protein